MHIIIMMHASEQVLHHEKLDPDTEHSSAGEQSHVSHYHHHNPAVNT